MSLSPSTNYQSLPNRWAAAWSSSDHDPSTWLSLYTPTATYIDHAFQNRRTGTSVLRNHFEIWRRAIPDFVMEVESVVEPPYASEVPEGLLVGKSRCIFRTVNRGTFNGDLPSRKATGTRFVFSGVVEFRVRDEDGLIEEVQEWYSPDFGRGKAVDEYQTVEESADMAVDSCGLVFQMHLPKT